MREGAVEEVLRELFPNGRIDGVNFCVGSLSGERGKSLQICLKGGKAGVWLDRATDDKGNLVTLVAEVLGIGNREAAEWLTNKGIELDGENPRYQPPPASTALVVSFPNRLPVPAERPSKDEEAVRRTREIKYAWEIFSNTVPADQTLVQHYLTRRAYTGVIPKSIRYAPEVVHTPTGQKMPCMVSAMVDGRNVFTGIHRTYLGRDALKSHVESNKMMLGTMNGSVVRLHEQDKPKLVGICEGIETGLSVMDLLRIPVWAAMNAGNMERIEFPKSVEQVLVCCDNDPVGRDAGKRAAASIKARHPKILVMINSPPPAPGVKDFNDFAYRLMMLGELTTNG